MFPKVQFLFFIIFLNDFANCCKDIVPFIFADDTNCLYSRDNIDLNFNTALQNIPNWISENKLSLNAEKTQLLHFMRPHDSDIKLAESVISESKCVKYLGMYLDKYLSFHEHIAYVKNKLSRHISVLVRLRSFLSKDVLLKYSEK